MQANILDKPAFPYRGLMIDTSRNFIPITHLKRMIHAMSQNKLNILHWHITDTNSFPFYSKSVPQVNFPCEFNLISFINGLMLRNGKCCVFR